MTLKYGLIGAGMMGQEHIRNIALLHEVEVAAFYEPDEGMAAAAQALVPQAARVAVPPLSNTFISLVKDTSLTSLILMSELFRKAQEIAAFTQEFMLLYIEAGIVYWVICLALSSGQLRIERRLERHVAVA